MDLREFSIFSDLPDHELAKVRAALRLKDFERREIVCRKQDTVDGLYLLMSGRLQVIDIAEDGREVGLNLLRPGAFFGELSVIDGQPRSAHIVALEASSVGILAPATARALFYQVPAAAEAILRHLTGVVRTLTSYRMLLALPNAFQRVHALLLQFSQPVPGGMVVIQNLPRQEEMAIMVNTSRETVSRAIARLVAQGVLEKDFRRLIVRDPQRLQEFATQQTASAAVPASDDPAAPAPATPARIKAASASRC
jgi:CRP-like cAMP-binding protein